MQPAGIDGMETRCATAGTGAAPVIASLASELDCPHRFAAAKQLDDALRAQTDGLDQRGLAIPVDGAE